MPTILGVDGKAEVTAHFQIYSRDSFHVVTREFVVSEETAFKSILEIPMFITFDAATADIPILSNLF